MNSDIYIVFFNPLHYLNHYNWGKKSIICYNPESENRFAERNANEVNILFLPINMLECHIWHFLIV